MKQYSIYDIGIETDRRPCRYDFHRYVGQRVRFFRSGETGTITEIPGVYYTYVRTDRGRDLVGTPTTICPVEEGETT